MKKKIVVIVISALLVVLSFGFTSYAKGNQNSIPEQIEELSNQIAKLLSSDDEINSEVNNLKTKLAESEDDISSLESQVNGLKEKISTLQQKPNTEVVNLPEQRLSFDNANKDLTVSVKERLSGNYSGSTIVPNMVVEVFSKDNPSDKLIGITDYKGSVEFKVKSGVVYEVVAIGNEHYKQVYSWGNYSSFELWTESY